MNNLSEKDNLDLQNYLSLREKICDTNLQVWTRLDQKIIELIDQTRKISPEIIDDINKAYDHLSQGIVPNILPTSLENPKDFKEFRDNEISLLEAAPEALRKMFNKLFKAYLKNSINNQLVPDEKLFDLLTKFNNENAELRYNDPKTNPYQNKNYKRTRDPKYDWRKKAADEFYPYYDGVLTMLSSIRNFQTHKEDAFTSSKFELAKRKIIEPVSKIDHPGSFFVLSNLIILSAYEFIEILQIWIDTQVRIGRI